MVRAHSISTLALFLTLLAQMISTEGRAIKSPAMKPTPQATSNEQNQRNTVAKTSKSPTTFFFTTGMAHETEFRPTAPGTSPGAGHAHTSKYEKEDISHCLNDKCPEDFHPTAPGDSPGAGHSFINNNDSDTTGRGKHIGAANTQAGQTAGHPSLKEMKKTNS